MTSCALGAKVIEKHIILDKSLGGVDLSFPLNLGNLKNDKRL